MSTDQEFREWARRLCDADANGTADYSDATIVSAEEGLQQQNQPIEVDND